MPFCGNCGADVRADAEYCPRCGFQGVVATKPEVSSETLPALAPTADRSLPHLRRLSWGIVLLTGYMALIAWAGLQATFFPQPPSAPVYLVDMSAPLLLANALILLLPLCMLLFIGAGLLGLRASAPALRGRLTWRLGRWVLGPLRLVGLVLLAIVVGFGAMVGLASVTSIGGGWATGPSLFTDAAAEALFVVFGWCLMVFPAKAIGPWTTLKESKAVSAASLVISCAALFAAVAPFVAAATGHSAVAPSASSYPVPPWVQGFSGLAAVMGLFTVAWVARRIVHRTEHASAQSERSLSGAQTER